jgi:hypothetical protein
VGQAPRPAADPLVRPASEARLGSPPHWRQSPSVKAMRRTRSRHPVGASHGWPVPKRPVETRKRGDCHFVFRLVPGGPDAVEGTWPLVVANVLAAPLIEMAPTLVRRLGPRARLILSGIPWSLESEVRQAYQHLGVRHIASRTRAGWTALIAQASW